MGYLNEAQIKKINFDLYDILNFEKSMTDFHDVVNLLGMI